jgi:hypothetical protein
VANLVFSESYLNEPYGAGSDVLKRILPELDHIHSQHNAILKQMGYLASVLKRSNQSSNDAATESTPGRSVDDSIFGDVQDSNAKGYTLSSKEYAELVTKAGQVEAYRQQLENSQTLLQEHIREIHVLKEALETSTSHRGDGLTESGPARLLQRQIDELKKVWSHELSANMILRNLIAKNQAEGMVAEQEARKQQLRLREEFDDLVALFEETHRETSGGGNGSITEKMAEEMERKFEERLNRQFFELEQQHQEQTQQLEDMYDKERSALNKLVANLEKERNRLVAELGTVKTSLGEKLADAISVSETTSRQLFEIERSKDDLHREYKLARDDIIRLQSELSKSQLETKRAHDELMSYYARSNMDKVTTEAWMNERRDLLRRVADLEQRERSLLEELQGVQSRLMWQDRTFDSDNLRSDKVRLIRAENEDLQRLLAHRDAQIRTLESRVQELLQDDRFPLPTSDYRVKEYEMEKLHNQILTADEVLLPLVALMWL